MRKVIARMIEIMSWNSVSPEPRQSFDDVIASENVLSIHSATHEVMTTAVEGMISCRKQKPEARENTKQMYRRL